MKKSRSILIVVAFAVVVLVAGTFFTINTMQTTNKEFPQDGYVLMNVGDVSQQDMSSSPVHFTSGANYRPQYPDKITFKDNVKETVSTTKDVFLHYTDGSVASLSNGVLLDVVDVGKGQIKYYNMPAETTIRKNGATYLANNMNDQLQLKDFVWKINKEKFIVVSDNITLELGKDDRRDVEDFVEVEYVNNGIIRLTSSDSVVQTISSDSKINLGSGVSIDLSTQEIVASKNTMSLKQMVLNADDNIDIVPDEIIEMKGIELPKFTTIDGEDGVEGTPGEAGESGDDGTEGKKATDGAEGGSGSSGGLGGVGATGPTAGTGTGTGEGGDGGDGEGGIENPQIDVPLFRLSEWKVTAQGATGHIQIEDEGARLVGGSVKLNVYDNANGRLVYGPESYDSMVFDFAVDDLEANREYRLTFEGEYRVDSIEYSRIFFDKVFVADDIGISFEKEIATTSNLSFLVQKNAYSAVSDATLVLYKEDGNVASTQAVAFDSTGKSMVNISGLVSNTPYFAQLTKVSGTYDDGSSFMLDEFGSKREFSTLKQTPTISVPTVVVNKRDAAFELQVTTVDDPDHGIVSYRYEIYDASNPTAKVPLKSVIVKDKSVGTIIVDDKILARNKNYVAKTIGIFNDNEKIVEIESGVSGIFSISGAAFPILTFEEKEVAHDKIIGTLKIDMSGGVLQVAVGKELKVQFTDSIGNMTTDTYTAMPSELGGVYNLDINKSNLRADDTYKISVRAYVDLRDGNPSQEILIGTQVVSTIMPKPFKANFADNSSTGGTAINVDFGLGPATQDRPDYEASTLTELDISLYSGAEVLPGRLIKTVTIRDTNTDPYISQIAAEYYTNDKTVNITEAFFGVPASELTQSTYTINIGRAVDYTTHKNKFVVESSTLHITKSEAAPPLPTEDDALIITAITKGNFASYGIKPTHFNPDMTPAELEKLEGNSILGYHVIAKYDNGGKLAKKFNYQLHKLSSHGISDRLNRATDVDTATMMDSYTLDVGADNTIPQLIVLFGAGDKHDEGVTHIRFNPNAQRGNQYFFSYTANLSLTNGNYLYPDDYPSAPANPLLYSRRLDAPRQIPTFQMYPSRTTNNSAIWKYKYQDIDTALVSSTINVLSSGQTGSTPVIAGQTSYADAELKAGAGLTPGSTYRAAVTQNLYSYPSTQEEKELFKRFFQGNKSVPTAAKFKIVPEPSKNRLYLELTDMTADEFQRIAGAKVTVTAPGATSKTMVLPVSMEEFSGASRKSVLITYAKLGSEFSQKTITINLALYYDDGNSGFEVTGTTNAIQLMNESTAGNYLVMTPGSTSGALSESPTASGSIFGSFQHTPPNLSFVNLITGGSGGIALQYNEKGAFVGGSEDYLTAKSLVEKPTNYADGSLSGTHNMSTLTPEVKLTREISTDRTAASVGIQVDGANVLLPAEFYVELHDSAGLSITKKRVTIPVTGDSAPYSFSVGGLSPGTNYSIRIWGNVNGLAGDTYFFDTKHNQSGVHYKFKTANTVTITDPFRVIYNADGYNAKYLNVQFKIDNVLGFKLFYDLFQIDATTGAVIRDYSHENMVSDGVLSPSGSPNNVNMVEKFMTSPGSKIIFGENYELRITAVMSGGVGDRNNTDYHVGSNVFKFKLSQLRAPMFGATGIGSFTGGVHKLQVKTAPMDFDRVLVDGKYKIRIFEENGTDITPATVRNHVYQADNVVSTLEFSPLKENTKYTIRYYGVKDMENLGGINDISFVGDQTMLSDPQYLIHELGTRTTNSSGISVGNITATDDATNTNRLSLVFNDSVDLESITSMQYVIYRDDGVGTVQGTTDFVPVVHNLGTADEFYSFGIPADVIIKGKLNIELRFYQGTTVIGDPEKLTYNRGLFSGFFSLFGR